MSDPSPDQALIVSFDYGSTDLGPLFALEEELEQAVADAGVGEFDGNEIAVDGTDGLFFLYGPSADALFAAVRPALTDADCIRQVVATLRYGPAEAGVEERVVRVKD